MYNIYRFDILFNAVGFDESCWATRSKVEGKSKSRSLERKAVGKIKAAGLLIFVHLYLILRHWISTGQSKCREGSLSTLESHCLCEGEGKRWTRIRPRRCYVNHAKESSPLMETNITMNLYFFIHTTLMINDSYTIITTDTSDVLFHVYSFLVLFLS